jgi:hypothetical protein
MLLPREPGRWWLSFANVHYCYRNFPVSCFSLLQIQLSPAITLVEYLGSPTTIAHEMVSDAYPPQSGNDGLSPEDQHSVAKRRRQETSPRDVAKVVSTLMFTFFSVYPRIASLDRFGCLSLVRVSN